MSHRDLKIQFVKSATRPDQCPADDLPEVGLVGRSNAGKSSLINAMAGKKVAKVSGAPGKTRLLNFFSVGEAYRLVDMPGYGYAARGAEERDSWGAMIENFIKERPNLVALVLIMDCRRSWAKEEQQLYDWVARQGLPLVWVLNKVDKLNQKERAQRQRQLNKELSELPIPPPVHWVSAQNKKGIVDFEEQVFQNWVAR